MGTRRMPAILFPQLRVGLEREGGGSRSDHQGGDFHQARSRVVNHLVYFDSFFSCKAGDEIKRRDGVQQIISRESIVELLLLLFCVFYVIFLFLVGSPRCFGDSTVYCVFQT